MSHNASLEELLKVAQLTGSRAFNAHKPDSDYDFIVTENMITNLKDDMNVYDYRTCCSMEAPDFYDVDGIADASELYHETSIWGPILGIDKYEYVIDELTDNYYTINLFIYSSRHADILPKFKELNLKMNFLYGKLAKVRETRIEKFIELTKKLGITDYKG